MEESIKGILGMKNIMQYQGYITIFKRLREKNFHQEYIAICSDVRKVKGERNGKSR